jgi:hypothetical protein
MLIRLRTVLALTLVVAIAALSGLTVSSILGGRSAQSADSDNVASNAPYRSNTGYLNPSAQAADSGGGGDGFELNPAHAYDDDPRYASNIDGPDDRHRYYKYGIPIPAGSSIDGIRVRLDWWTDGAGDENSLSVDISWDGGVSWTAPKTAAAEAGREHTAVLGGTADTWGRAWTVGELSNASFLVRVSCNCSGETGCDGRDFFLDWVAVNVYYTPPQ